MTTEEVLEAIVRDRKRLYAAIDALGADASTRTVTEEGYTAKDIVSFMVHWAGQIAFGLGAQLEPPEYVVGVKERPSADEWNARAVRFYADLSLDDVKAELDRNVDALIERVRNRSQDEINATDALPWAGNRPLWQQIGIETFENWRFFSERIEAAAGVD